MSEQTAAKRAARAETVNPHVLSRVQRSEIASQLVLAMANDFNNALMAISGYAELELKKAAPGQKRGLEQLLNSATRATSIMGSLVELSTSGQSAPQALSVNELMEGIGDLVRPILDESVAVELTLDPHVKTIQADLVEIRQVLLYTILEARHEIARNQKLILSTELVSFSNDEGSIGGNAHSYLKLGLFYGTGHPQEIEASPAVQSSGALSACKSLTESGGGFARILEGTTGRSGYQLYFTVKPSQPGEKIEGTRVAPSSKTILVVDDDDAVRIPAIEFLKMEGYRVLQAGNGAEALRIVEQNVCSVDLLLTDIVMQGMSGQELAKELRKANPQLTVLFISGNTEQIALSELDNTFQAARLQKPFRLAKLNEKVQELLRM